MNAARPTLALLAALCASACGDKLEAHLGKFMDPAARRAEALPPPADAYALGESPEVADRVLGAPAREAAARLGAHRLQAQTSFRFTRGSEVVELKESTLLVQAADGGFRLKVENQAGQGYELLHAGEQLWVRQRYGKFHPRDLLEAQHLRWRDEATRGHAAVARLFRGRLAFAKQGLARHHGRDAVRYGLSLGAGPPRLPGASPPPAAPAGVTRYAYPVEPTPSDEDRWRDQAQPLEAQGSLLVDTDTGLLLELSLRGRLAWKNPGGEAVDLQVSATLVADGFGNPASLPPPPEAEVAPIPDREVVDTRPLDFFFGKGYTSTLGPPAGVARKSEDEKKAADSAAPVPAIEGGEPSNP